MNKNYTLCFDTCLEKMYLTLALNNEILPDSFIEKIAEIVDDELNLEIEEYEKNETHVPDEHDSTILETKTI